MSNSATVPVIHAPSRTRPASAWRDLLIGVMIVAVAPSAFWTGVMVAAARTMDIDLPLWGLAIPCLLMLGLLLCVWASLGVASRADSHPA